MVKKCLHVTILGAALPFLSSLFVYQGFATNHTGRVFHEAGFRAQYESGIFKYRVLGRHLLLGTHRLLLSGSQSARIARDLFGKLPASVWVLDRRADRSFYAAYFLQNTFFLVLASLLLYVLLGESSGVPVSAGYVAGVALMTISQYVVSPYDTLSYFLILLSFLLISRPLRFNLPILALVLVISTLARESSVLALCFYAAWHHRELLRFERRRLTELMALVATFLLTYALLRIQLGFENAFWQQTQLHVNLSEPLNVAGLAALAVIAYLICAGAKDVGRCLVFLGACAPYLIAMLVIANTREIRLWVPVWLGLICLVSLTRSAHRIGCAR